MAEIVTYTRLYACLSVCMLLRWSGMEDKPFYKMQFVGPAGRTVMNRDEPFWETIHITHSEYAAILSILENSGIVFETSPQAEVDMGYRIDLHCENEVYYGWLGLARTTLDLLKRIHAALQAEHQAAMRPLLTRIAPLIEFAP